MSQPAKPKGPNIVVCSCGWTRECSSRWAAESAAKLHLRLAAPGPAHTLTIEGPPGSDARRQPDLPLA